MILSQHLASDSKPFRATFVYDQARALSEACDVIIVDLQPSRRGFSIEQEPPRDWAHGVPTFRVTFKSGSAALSHLRASIALLRLTWSLAREGRKPSVMHAHWWAAAIPAIPACKALGIPLVLTEHGSRWSSYGHSKKGLWLGRATLAAVDVVIPVSRWLQSVLEEQGVRARMHVIPNMVDVAAFRKSNLASRVPQEPPTLVLVGRLTEEKGIDDAIRAVALLRADGVPCRLEVIGSGAALESLQALAQREGVGDAVYFHGGLSRSQIVQAFERVDVMVSATKTSETFGVAVAEGLAAGIPIVATAVGAIPELINDDNGILVEPQNPGALAKGIQMALERTWNRELISRSGERFDREHVLEQILAIYTLLGVPTKKTGSAPEQR